jgi:hypothetical protein
VLCALGRDAGAGVSRFDLPPSRFAKLSHSLAYMQIPVFGKFIEQP